MRFSHADSKRILLPFQSDASLQNLRSFSLGGSRVFGGIARHDQQLIVVLVGSEDFQENFVDVSGVLS